MDKKKFRRLGSLLLAGLLTLATVVGDVVPVYAEQLEVASDHKGYQLRRYCPYRNYRRAEVPLCDTRYSPQDKQDIVKHQDGKDSNVFTAKDQIQEGSDHMEIVQ